MANYSAFGSGVHAAPLLSTVGTTNIYPDEEPSLPAAGGQSSAWGLALHFTRAEWTACLRAALLMLWGRDDVPEGLPGQWPKQMPGDDQLASTLTWKGLWIWGCCSNAVFSVVSVITYTWTWLCTVWFVYIPHQFLQIPFPRPTWQHTGISQQWLKCVNFLLKWDSLESPLMFVFCMQNDKRTENCFTKSVWIRLPCEERYQLVLVLLVRCQAIFKQPALGMQPRHGNAWTWSCGSG